MKPANRPKGIAGYRMFAGRAERGMRHLARNVASARCRELGIAYAPTKQPKDRVRRNY